MPLSISALIAAVLAIFLWAAFREVAATLVRAGGDRAQGAANQIANLLERPAQQSLDELRRTASDRDVLQFVREPSDRARAAAARTPVDSFRQRHGPPARRAVERIREARARGRPARAEPGPRATAAAGLAAGPNGLSEFHESGGVVFSDAVAEIADPVSPEANRLGFLVVRSAITVSPPGILSRLVGRDATILIGSTSGGAWTDLARVLPATRRSRAAAWYSRTPACVMPCSRRPAAPKRSASSPSTNRRFTCSSATSLCR